MSWFTPKAQPKNEHPCKGEWDAIAELQEEHKHPLLKRPPNPALDIIYGKWPPASRVDRRLIGEDQR